MNPDIWGPKAWFFLYSIALAYPENPSSDDKKNYYSFFLHLKNILPCAKCRKHYSQNLELYPLTDEILNSKLALFKWLHSIQNAVRKKHGKKEYTLASTYEFYNKEFSNKKYPIGEAMNMKLIIALIIILLAVGGLILYKKNFNKPLILAN